MSYSNVNYNFWQKGYFAPNVESFIFRFYGHYLKNKKKNIKRILDFGCGQGAAVNFFNQNKINTIGVDISKVDINHAKKRFKKFNKKFIHIKSLIDMKKKLNNTKFDVIIASQSLYYLNDKDFRRYIIELKKLMSEDSILFVSMISTKSHLYKNSVKETNGLNKVFSGKNKTGEFHYINFTKNYEHLKEKFRDFEPMDVGYYSVCLNKNYDINHHYTFIGKNN